MGLNEVLGIIGALSAVFGVYAYLKSRRYRRLRFAYRLGSLHTRTHPEMRITYRGHDVSSLAQVTLYCWSDGTEDIRAADLPANPKISVTAPCRVLSVAVLHVEGQSTQFTAEHADDGSVELSFAYLNHDNGAILELIVADFPRTGVLNCEAPVVGGRSETIRVSARPGRNKDFIRDLIVNLAPVVAGLLLMALSRSREAFILGLAFVVTQGIQVIDRYRRVRASRAPKFVQDHITSY